MKLLLMITILLVPLSARAEHLDVIKSKLKPDCTLNMYVALKNDFNAQWGKSHGYVAQIAMPIQSDDLTAVYWTGRSASAEAFGKAWDVWRTESADPKSVVSGLQARFEKCTIDESRRGYDLY